MRIRSHRLRPLSVAARAAAALALACALGAGVAPDPARGAMPVGAVFLRVGVGARSAGIADADIVHCPDASALHWNPATLASATRREFLLLHNEWLGDVRQEYAGGVAPLGGGGLGIGLNGLYIGNIPRYVSDVPAAEAEGDFGAYDLAAQSGYGRFVHERVAVGIAAKGIFQKIDIETAYGIAADIGALYRTPIAGLDAAAVVANIGPAIRFLGAGAALPSEVRVGLGYARPIGLAALRAYALGRAMRRLNPRAQFGIEGTLRGVSLRLGGKIGYDLEDATYGLGYAAGRFAFDYAFVPFSEEDLGEAHRVSVAFSL